MLDEIFLLNLDGIIQVYTLSEGLYERTIQLKNYKHLFNIDELKKTSNINFYLDFKENESKSISKLHTILEYNHRYEENILNFSTINKNALI